MMHERFLLAALEQAWLGRGYCAPNPSVGAVAVQNNQIIAQTWHRGAGTPHAEQLLLAQLSDVDVSDITLYVTLEPCNHWGKTPPCTELIIQRGVRRVVYAYPDPNPIVVRNNTSVQLREAGVEILHHPLPKIDQFYASYTHWIRTKMPWVTVKIAQTFDGKIAGGQGEPILLSNDHCAEFTHQQRLYSDVILTTATTIKQDNPKLNVRLPYQAERAKPVAILDRELKLDFDADVFKKAKHCHIFHDKEKTQPKDSCSFHRVSTRQDRTLDLKQVLSDLATIGYHDVWVEAGSRLFNALHRLNLVQRTYIYLVPRVLGENNLSLYHNQDLFQRASRIDWRTMKDNVIAILDWESA